MLVGTLYHQTRHPWVGGDQVHSHVTFITPSTNPIIPFVTFSLSLSLSLSLMYVCVPCSTLVIKGSLSRRSAKDSTISAETRTRRYHIIHPTFPSFVPSFLSFFQNDGVRVFCFLQHVACVRLPYASIEHTLTYCHTPPSSPRSLSLPLPSSLFLFLLSFFECMNV